MAAQLTATKRPVAAAAVPVDGPRHQLLPRSAVPQEKHRRVGVRHHPDLLEHALHGLRAAEDVVEAVAALDLGPEPTVLLAQLLVLDGALDHQRQLGKLERLRQVVVRALAHRVDRALETAERRHEDDAGPRLDALRLAEHRQAVDRLHDEVGQDDRVLLAPQRGLRVLTARHRRHRPALHLEVPPEERHHVGIVVHDEDSRFHDCSLLSSDSASGSQTVNVVPSPGLLATRISLPLDRTRSRQIASPSPAPSWAGFVLKNGIEDSRQDVLRDARARCPRTAMATPGRPSSAWGRPVTWTRPPDGVASMAFVRRLIRTCWRWPGSTCTGGKVLGKRDREGHAAALREVLEERLEHLRDRVWRDGRPRGLALTERIQGRADHPGDPIDLGDDDVQVLAERGVRRQRAEHELGAPRDDVERRPHLVRDARAELAGDRERLGLAQPPHELERPVRLGLHPLPGLLEPLGHPVEGRRHLAQLVAAPDRDRRARLAGRDALDPLHQIGDGRNTRRWSAAQMTRPSRSTRTVPRERDLVVLAEEIGFQAPGDEVDLEHAVVVPGGPHGQQHASGSACRRSGARRRPAGPCLGRSDADRATRPGHRRGGSRRLAARGPGPAAGSGRSPSASRPGPWRGARRRPACRSGARSRRPAGSPRS